MKKQPLKALALTAAIAGGLAVGVAQAAQVSDVMKAGASKVNAAKTAQVKIDRIYDQTDSLLQEFKQVNKQIDNLRVYNSQLEAMIGNQKSMMGELEESIENATIIERGISPLMANMLKALEDFINLDLPFKKEERIQAVADLVDNLESARYSNAEKFRQILEVYDIEAGFSSTIETYRDMVDVGGEELQVDVLRVGRVALMYQKADKSAVGAWNKETNSWETLGSEYRRPIDQGIRIAKKLSPQDVIELPIHAPGA